MAAGAGILEIPAGKNFEFPTAELLRNVSGRTKLIAIANPNNPTGTLVPQNDLAEIASKVPSAAVLIDEAYFEFCGQTAVGLVKEHPNVFVARTFSKAYGLAGLRLGALVGGREQMEVVRLVCSPYNVNCVAIACLPAALDDVEYIKTYVSDVLHSRARLEQFLQGQGIPFWRSQANFVLFRVGSTKADSMAFADRMRREGILVRDRSSDYGCEGCVRVTLGPREHTDRLLDALRVTLELLEIQQGMSQR